MKFTNKNYFSRSEVENKRFSFWCMDNFKNDVKNWQCQKNESFVVPLRNAELQFVLIRIFPLR